jgi:2-oxoglutarate ferredoxin oxidoreductase subunit gamma
MEHQVIIAGFGGQGVMLIGKILAHAGMKEGKEVSWLPSYGPEMRGGTSNCTVVVSDEPVGSPLVYRPSAVIAMNEPSLAKFEPSVKAGGVLLVNTCLVRREPGRCDIRTVKVPANDVAVSVGNVRAANMVALGAYIGTTNVVALETVETVIREKLGGKPQLVEANLEALRHGHELALKAAEREAA